MSNTIYTQLPISASASDTVDKAVQISLSDLATFARHTASAEQEKQTVKLYYDNMNTMLHSTLNGKACKSGDIVTYDNLSKPMFAGIVNLFSGMQYQKDYDTAVKRLRVWLYNEYKSRLVSALDNKRTYINIISRKTLLDKYNEYYNTAQNNTLVYDTLPIAMEVLHDMIVFALDNHLTISDLSLPFSDFKRKYQHILYKRTVKRYRNTASTTITDTGIYRTKSDGKQHKVYHFKSKTYTHIVSKYNNKFDDAFIAFSNPFTITDTYEYSGKWIIVNTSTSVYDVFYQMCNKFIEQERRSYTSANVQVNTIGNMDKDNNNGIDIATIDADLQAVENSDLSNSLLTALIKQGVKRDTAVKFVKFSMLLSFGYTQEQAQQAVHFTRQGFAKIRKQYGDIIRTAIKA